MSAHPLHSPAGTWKSQPRSFTASRAAFRDSDPSPGSICFRWAFRWALHLPNSSLVLSAAVAFADYKFTKNEYSKPSHDVPKKLMFPKWGKWICFYHQPFNVVMGCFSSKQYRAYYEAFKAVNEKNRAFEEMEDLRALRFLSVISIVDPWIFIIFRTPVFRMSFHKIFIRPLMDRNWYGNSCRTNMESSLWQCFTTQSLVSWGVCHIFCQRTMIKRKKLNNLKAISQNKTPQCVFKSVW